MDQRHDGTADLNCARGPAMNHARPLPEPIARPGWLGRGWVRRYGGHPVGISLDGKMERRRLFVGGRERTAHRTRLLPPRPAVDVIVNVCDRPDLPEVRNSGDLWYPHGEGPLGYRAETLLAEAKSVIDLLLNGKSVLVHCIAGVNRAPTLCIAVIMILDHMTARNALARVRQHRWMAFPDPWHWHALRTLETWLREREVTDRDATRSA